MLNIAFVGFGQITKLQHLPVLKESSRFELVAIIDPIAQDAGGLPIFPDLATMVNAKVHCDCVAICTPPSARFDLAREAIALGLHILLEKPPVVALSQLETLEALAIEAQVTLYTAWHSRHAPCAKAATRLLKGKKVASIDVCWMENHERWHPGAKWLWKSGGYGCFDAGVNGLSLIQFIMDEPLIYEAARLEFESGTETPIRAELKLLTGAQAVPITAWFDIGYQGDPEIRTIKWHLADGRTVLATNGGAQLAIDDVMVDDPVFEAPDLYGEYRALYQEFASLISRRESEVYRGPYVVATDCLAHGQRLNGRFKQVG